MDELQTKGCKINMNKTPQAELKACPFEVNEGAMVRFYNKKKTDDQTGCWNWMGAIQSNGYGNFYFAGNNILAHRFSYEAHKGRIPGDLTINHKCKNTRCVNPDHLEIMTQYENSMLGDNPMAINARKTVCINGHSLTGNHIKIINRKDGIRRQCRKCAAIYQRRSRERKKQNVR